MSKPFDPLAMPLEKLLPASRFRNYPESAAANMPSSRFVPATKPAQQFAAPTRSSERRTERSEGAPAGTTIFGKD